MPALESIPRTSPAGNFGVSYDAFKVCTVFRRFDFD